jgi:YrbI family 3-deoxy-D-manno-octulosonate 8-phosphate phosphatase
VRLIVFDVDGVLTRGDLIYGPDGEWKVFNVHDGHGFVMARRMGLKTALLTARTSAAVRRRAKQLRVDAFLEGARGKAKGLRAILQKLKVRAEETCYIGDDLLDLPAMEMVGFPAAVAGAADDVRTAAAFVTRRAGGEGAARELIEHILRAHGLWKKAVAAGREP